jgi:Tfp pilus assembly protein PilV
MRRSLASEAGETLMEVLISAVLIALIVVAMFNGFDVTNRASAAERSRAQANALAQQAEDKLRSLPLATLETLEAKPLVEKITQNKTEYTVTSTAQYVSDSTATTSCSSSAASASYLRTSSSVTWGSLGTRKPVIQSNIISPPPGSALIAQVTNGASEAVAGVNVTAAGPTPAATEHTLTTASSGCAILSLLPGEYNINVSKTGYVDQNWYTESKLDPNSTHSIYLTAESAAKEPFSFGQAGTLEVNKFNTPGSTYKEGDSFVAFNSGMSAFKSIGTLAKYAETAKSPAEVYPFATKYIVYAGTCEEDNPKSLNPKNEVKEVLVPPGGTGKVEVTQPPINIKVMSGSSKATPGKSIENALVTLSDEGCKTKRESKTIAKGVLQRPGAPFGEYKLCVTGGKEGGVNKEGTETKGLAAKKKYTTNLFENDASTGPSKLAEMTNGGTEELEGKKFAAIYMGAAEKAGELEAGETCP